MHKFLGPERCPPAGKVACVAGGLSLLAAAALPVAIAPRAGFGRPVLSSFDRWLLMDGSEWVYLVCAVVFVSTVAATAYLAAAWWRRVVALVALVPTVITSTGLCLALLRASWLLIFLLPLLLVLSLALGACCLARRSPLALVCVGALPSILVPEIVLDAWWKSPRKAAPTASNSADGGLVLFLLIGLLGFTAVYFGYYLALRYRCGDLRGPGVSNPEVGGRGKASAS